jgi:hypothetical protein
MEKNIIEEITKSVAEMKRMRKSLREQVKSVFDAIEKVCDNSGITFNVIADKKKYSFDELWNESTRTNYITFCEKYTIEDSEGTIGIKSFYGSCLEGDSFSNDDVIYLARNIKPILEAIQKKLGEKMAVIEEAQKYLA